MVRALVALALLGLGAEAQSSCPPLMSGLTCEGGTFLEQSGVATPERCCDLCALHWNQTLQPRCGAFTHFRAGGVCALKESCPRLKNGDAESGVTSGLPETLPPARPPTCVLPRQGSGFRCDGKALETRNASGVGACCDLCSARQRCGMFSYHEQSGLCRLMRSCPKKPQAEGWTTGWAPPPRTGAVQYQVGQGSFHIQHYRCTNASVTALWYPKGEGPFPVVVYGHGLWGEIDENDDWLAAIASMGMIVIAPFGGPNATVSGCGSGIVHDFILALKAAKHRGGALHPVLKQAEWTRVGIIGQSWGAMHAIAAARKLMRQGEFAVSAVVLSSDVPRRAYKDLDFPVMLTTGSLDKANQHNRIVEYFKNNLTSPQKVLANLRGAFHMEPQEGERLNYFTAAFLRCHASREPEVCEAIYGAGNASLCQANRYTDCIVVGGPPSVDGRPRTVLEPSAVLGTPGVLV